VATLGVGVGAGAGAGVGVGVGAGVGAGVTTVTGGGAWLDPPSDPPQAARLAAIAVTEVIVNMLRIAMFMLLST